jgi:hypothetical protein
MVFEDGRATMSLTLPPGGLRARRRRWVHRDRDAASGLVLVRAVRHGEAGIRLAVVARVPAGTALAGDDPAILIELGGTRLCAPACRSRKEKIGPCPR